MFAHDPETAAHQERVGALARRLAGRLGLDRDHAERIGLAGSMHDIGKLAVARRLLLSAAPLGPTERRLVQSHAWSGARMLERIGVPPEICEAVQSHHERLDGRGYPLGLDARHISIEARVVAVADVIDAMTSNRPHCRRRGSAGTELRGRREHADRRARARRMPVVLRVTMR